MAFWGLYAHLTKRETLEAAYREAKANGGSPGIDGESFEAIEMRGLEKFLGEIRRELLSGTYKPSKNRRVEIPKGSGKTRTLGIPTIKDRVVQGAAKLVLEPIFEADFHRKLVCLPAQTHGASGIGSGGARVGARAHPSHRR